ncbi:MAG: right-handed parallel beta-helix repeat-containing protein [Verrucomicrobiae bacterium]|nr:right-handed parallel beta-helix repeat-containing protein [Verrucomicrobiae bacterium]
MRTLVLINLAAGMAMSALTALGAGDSSSLAAWRKFANGLASQPDVERCYLFDNLTPQSLQIPEARGGAPLRFQAAPAAGQTANTLQIVEGRWPGKTAVRLDAGALVGPAFNPTNRAFTVAGWFRKNGPGAHRGNNQSPNGGVVGTGDGYWSGWRVYSSYPQKNASFEIGRPQPSSARSLSGGLWPDGVWVHLAATWDGREMRLYLHGDCVAATPYDGAYTPAAGNAFRLGYFNAGIGSLVLEVDECTIYRRALSAAEVLALAWWSHPLPGNAASTLEAARLALARKEYAAAELALSRLPATPAPLQGLAGLRRAEVLRLQNQPAAAAHLLLQLTQQAPPPLSATALESLRRIFMEAGAPDFGAAVAERIYRLPDLSERERLMARRALAQASREAGQWPAALEHYTALAQAPAASPRERWEARMALIHTHFEARNHTAVRAECQRLLGEAEAPALFKGLAQMRLAQSFEREKQYARALEEYRKLETLPDVPAHWVAEARQAMTEISRLQRGLPAWDAEATRTPPAELPQPGAVFYVAPQGSDANPGTAAKPFASLARAREAVRQLKSQGQLPAGGVTILVQGGEYALREPFRLEARDSGQPGRPIVYRAAPNQKPRFVGSQALSGFTPVTDPALKALLPAASREQVLQCDLRALGLTNWGAVTASGRRADLYFNGTRLTLARWPNTNWVQVGKLLGGTNTAMSIHARRGNREGRFTFDFDRPARWQQEPEIWLHGYWFWDWAEDYQRVAALDLTNRSITLAPPAASYGYHEGQPYYALNLFAEIDLPGEWYLDRTIGRLYLLPPGKLAGARVTFPLLDGPMVTLTNVAEVALVGLQFEEGRGDGVILSGCTNVSLLGCSVARFGENGVIIQGGTQCTLFGCDIFTLGRNGTIVRGGDRRTLQSAGHLVENCHIYEMSRFKPTYTPAILAEGVGIRLRHNRLHTCPSSAMRIEGNDHLIEFNEVFNVVRESDDQGGADMWGNPTYRGVVYRYNFWHHIGNPREVGQAGIRLDDAICGVLIYGNIFYRCAEGLFGGVQIHGGKDNIVDHNLFVDCQAAVSFSAWGARQWKEFLDRPEIRRKTSAEVDLLSPPYATRYPGVADLESHADRNYIWRNAVIQCRQFLLRSPAVTELLDNYISARDPGFANLARGDFRLPDRAVLYDRLVWRPLPVSAMGLYPHPLRASAPPP